MNSMTLTGYVVADAIHKTFIAKESGNTFGKTYFRIADSKSRFNKEKNEYEKLEDFFLDCEIHGEKGLKLLPYLLKGKKIGIIGMLRYSQWETTTANGEVKFNSKHYLSVNAIEFLSPKDKDLNKDDDKDNDYKNEELIETQSQKEEMLFKNVEMPQIQ